MIVLGLIFVIPSCLIFLLCLNGVEATGLDPMFLAMLCFFGFATFVGLCLIVVGFIKILKVHRINKKGFVTYGVISEILQNRSISNYTRRVSYHLQLTDDIKVFARMVRYCNL